MAYLSPQYQITPEGPATSPSIPVGSTSVDPAFTGELFPDLTVDSPVYEDTISLPRTQIQSKTITTSFGREEDYVELHIHNTAGQLIYSEPNFQDYSLGGNTNAWGVSTATTSHNIKLEPEKILSDRGYISGQYVLKIHIHRDKIFHSAAFPFYIKEISTSRREIKSISEETTNKLFDDAVMNFILEVESTSYFKEFVLNFGNGILIPAINLILNKDPLKHELILKTLDPLPTDIHKESRFKVVEELTDPISITVNLGDPVIIDNSIELNEPNFQIDTRQKSSIPSTFKTYNDILSYNITSSYNHLLNKLENPDTINIKYDYIRNVSSSMEELDRPYHFENFIHFSSATKRLKNFRYKLKQIELYESQISETKLISGSLTGSNTLSNIKDKINTKKRNIIKNFDGYEHFLYFTTGSNLYTWPKHNDAPPFKLFSISSSEAIEWLGSENDASDDYGGQLQSSSFYDRENQHNLYKLVPEHILENSHNNLYVDFINMMGQHFDHIWTHIKHLTEIHNADNKFGISKELVYFQLKSLGIDTFDQFENSNLIEYILGEGLYGNAIENGLIIGNWVVGSNSHNFYNIDRGITNYVTASNQGSIPKGQITKEIWKRLYNNSPYLLKTKGTERGLRALMSCYGVPSTILNVKEYGGNTRLSGPLKDLDTSGTYKTFSYDKSGLALQGESGTGGHFIATKWSSSLTDALEVRNKTIEFRVKPIKLADSSNQHLFTLSGSDQTKDPSLILTTHTGADISASNDASQYGRLDLYINGASVASSSNFPIYNGDFWNIYIGVSGSHNTSANINFGAYQSNWLKHVSYYTGSPMPTLQTSADRQLTFGDPTHGGNNIGGGHTAYFGGIPANVGAQYADITNLRFSGSIQEIKYHFGELLSHETLKKHALEPFMYSGNTPSSSIKNVVLRLPLGSNDQENSGSFHPIIENNYLEYAGVNYSAIQSGFIIDNYSRRVSSSLASQEWEEVVEKHHLPTPDTVGASMTSEKVRIDTGTIPSDNILVVNRKVETSTLDRQPPDYEDLGIFFSPNFEMNEDILYTLGSFRLDDYIGSPLPSAQSASVYEDLKDIKKHYTEKLRFRYKYWDYIKLIQEFDHTLFKIIEQFVPFKANTKTGLLIEPTYLERSKFQREVPIRSDGQTMTTGSHQTINAQIGTYNAGNKIMAFSPTLLYTPAPSYYSGSQTYTSSNDFIDPFATSSNIASITGQWEPGSYVVSNNNLTFTTSSKTNERIEQGTNGTIEIHEDYVDPSKRDPNAYNNQSCQSPVVPYTQQPKGIGVGFAAIGSSFTIGNYYLYGNNTGRGIGYSAIERTFVIENYRGGGAHTWSIGNGQPGIGAKIGSTFVVGTYSNIPRRSFNYKSHESSVLLGNIMTGKKSKKYFNYTTTTL